MIDLPYSLTIEATEEPDYFGFYSPDMEGFTGIGHSVEDCIYKDQIEYPGKTRMGDPWRKVQK